MLCWLLPVMWLCAWTRDGVRRGGAAASGVVWCVASLSTRSALPSTTLSAAVDSNLDAEYNDQHSYHYIDKQ